ncbi:hypothetical protein WN944_024120 [Citrus x changshan-huyou]|uniref:Uncharacterized protein n=1 Tax=Citrus x changshan-huyou TaxID=2935761 RepID=A0AAP0LMD8_9ROSI
MAIGFAPVVAYLKSGGSLYMNESLNVKHGLWKLTAKGSIDTLEVNCKRLKPWEASLVKSSSPVSLEGWT